MLVLLVDDEEELVSTPAERLGFRDIDADWVTSGEEGMRLVLANDYDWVVLDLEDAGHRRAGDAQGHQAPAPGHVLTGHSAEEEYKAVMQASASYYLLKPLEVDDLIACMQA